MRSAANEEGAARGQPRAKLDCPAAPQHWKGAVVFGVAGGTPEAPEIIPVEPQPVTPEVLALAAPATPREVFRMAATCIKHRCRHWDTAQPGAQGDGACSLVQRVVTSFAATAELPVCGIRASCRWWAQEGRAACLGCPGVVTDIGELPQDQEGEADVPFL